MAAVAFSQDLTANTNFVLMESPANFDTTLNIRMVNRNGTPARIRIALVDDIAANALTSLGNNHYIEFDVELRPNGVLEDSGIAVPSGSSIVVRADSNNVNAISYGFQEQVI